MSNSYIWIIEYTKQLPINIGHIANAYVANAKDGIDSNNLAGSCIYIILRNTSTRRDFLYGRIIVRKVEKIVEEGYRDCFLLSVNFIGSIITSNSIDTLTNYETTSLTNGYKGICIISGVEEQLLKIIKHKIKRKINTPNVSEISKLLSVFKRTNNNILARKVLSLISSKFQLSSLWGSQNESNPYANFALKACSDSGITLSDDLSISIRNISEYFFDSSASLHSKSERNASIVDTEFQPIDVNSIYARRFLASESQFNAYDIMAKTELAEKRHQNILKELSNMFYSKNIVPMQTSSIDLAVFIDGTPIIVEIKTITEKNIISQVSKGIFQLASYSLALTNEFNAQPIRILFLDTFKNLPMSQYIETVNTSMGIHTYFFDNEVGCKGFFEFINTLQCEQIRRS